MRAVAYLRVSSRSQDARSQRSAIAQAARARGDTIGEWLSERRSAGRLSRPVLNELRRRATAGQVRRLYVFRLDRLTRSGIRDTLELVEELGRGGCELVTVADGFELGGPAAELVLAVMAWAAEMERLAIGERIAAARVRVEAAGGRWGRPRRLSPADERRALALASSGRSVRAVAIALKVPRSTVQRALCRARALPSRL